MKQKIKFFLLCLCLALFSGCTADTSDEEDDGKLTVVATIFPQYDFIREIAGDKVNLTMLLPPGSESHSFEPTPQDIIRIQNSDLFIYVGGESDSWADRILDSMDREEMTIVPLLTLINAVEEEIVEGMEDGHEHDDNDEDHGHDGEDDHDHPRDLDEHVWTSPKNAMIIVDRLSEALCRLDPENSGFYRQNTTDYLEKLRQLDLAFTEAVETSARNTVVFADRFPFRYLADAYGLAYYAAFPGCSTESEASAATIAFLINKVADENIPVVFYIEFSNEKLADVICESTGAEKRLLHSCHNLTRDDFLGGITYYG